MRKHPHEPPEITQDMIEAGVNAYFGYSEVFPPDLLVKEVFVAMWLARQVSCRAAGISSDGTASSEEDNK